MQSVSGGDGTFASSAGLVAARESARKTYTLERVSSLLYGGAVCTQRIPPFYIARQRFIPLVSFHLCVPRRDDMHVRNYLCPDEPHRKILFRRILKIIFRVMPYGSFP
jgi:hypothetical protein